MNAGQPVRTPTTVKHMMEAFGVPHAKVDIILANGESAGFNRILREDNPRYQEVGKTKNENGELFYMWGADAGAAAQFVDPKFQYAPVTFYFKDHRGGSREEEKCPFCKLHISHLCFTHRFPHNLKSINQPVRFAIRGDILSGNFALLATMPQRGRNPLRAPITGEDEIRN